MYGTNIPTPMPGKKRGRPKGSKSKKSLPNPRKHRMIEESPVNKAEPPP